MGRYLNSQRAVAIAKLEALKLQLDQTTDPMERIRIAAKYDAVLDRLEDLATPRR